MADFSELYRKAREGVEEGQPLATPAPTPIPEEPAGPSFSELYKKARTPLATTTPEPVAQEPKSFQEIYQGARALDQQPDSPTIMDRVKGFGKEVAASNLEALGFHAGPVTRLGERISPSDTRIGRPVESDGGGVRFYPDSEKFSPAMGALEDVSRGSLHVAETLPAEMLKFYVLGGVSKALKLPTLIGGVTKLGNKAVGGALEKGANLLIDRGGPVMSQGVRQVMQHGAESSGTLGLMSFLGTFVPELSREGQTPLEALKKGAKSGLVGAATAPLFEFGMGAAGGVKTANTMKRAESGLTKEVLQGVPDKQALYEHFRQQGVPSYEATQMAEKYNPTLQANEMMRQINNAPKQITAGESGSNLPAVQSRVMKGDTSLLDPIRSAERFMRPPGEGFTVQPSETANFQAGLPSNRISVSQAADSLKMQYPKATDQELWTRLGDMGYDVGKRPSDFYQKVTQDTAAIRAGSNLGRVWRTDQAPGPMNPAEVEQAYQNYGVYQPVAEEAAKKTAAVAPKGPPKTPQEAAKVQTILEEAMVKTEEMAPKPEERVFTSQNGKTTVDYGPKDIWPSSKIVLSPPQLAREPEFKEIYVPAAKAASDQTYSNQAIEGMLRPYRSLPKMEMKRVGDVLIAEDAKGIPYTDMELAKMNLSKDAMSFYREARMLMEKVSQTRVARGEAVRDFKSYWPHVFEGNRQVGYYEGKNFVTLNRFADEKAMVSWIEDYLGKNPAARIVVKNPVNVPDEVMAMVPRNMRKQFLKEVRTSVGPEDTQVTTTTLQAVKGRGGRFFGSDMRRAANLDTFIKDPIRTIELYLKGQTKKWIMDDFNKVAYEAFAKIPGQKQNLVDASKDFIDWMNNPTTWVDRVVRTLSEKTRIPGTNVSLLPADRVLPLVTKYEAISKLGYNATSPLINFGQLVFNVHTKLGNEWTARGVSEAINTSWLGRGKNLLENQKVLSELGFSFPMNDPAGLAQYAKLAKLGKINPLWMFEKSENAQKSVAALGEYWRSREALRLPHKEALANARVLMDQTIFNPSIAGNPAYMRGPALKGLFQFKSYAYKEIEFWARLNTKEKASFMAKLFAIGGPSAIPLATYLPGFREARIENPRAMRGLLGVAGVDMSDTVSPFNINLRDFNSVTSLVTPAVGEAVSGVKALTSGDPMQENLFKRQMTPVVARRVGDAFQQLQDGMYRSPSTGEAIAPVTTGEAIAQGIGLRPVKLGQVRDIESYVKDLNSELQLARRRVLFDPENATPEDEKAFASHQSLMKAKRRAKEMMRKPKTDRMDEKVQKKDRKEIRQMVKGIE